MCGCGKPTINGQPGAYSWDGKGFMTYPLAPPALAEGDTLIYDEPGRCGGIDSHSHHFRLVKMQYGGHALLVRHGGGDERVSLGYSANLMLVGPMEGLDSNARYWLLHGAYSLYRDTKQHVAEQVTARFKSAFVEGRLKKKKVRGRNVCKVWIEEPKPAAVQQGSTESEATNV